MNDINLLPKNNIAFLKQERAVIILRRISMIVLAATAFISIAVFILILQSPLSKSKQEEQSLIEQISHMSNRISRTVITRERLTSIDTVLKSRKSFEKTMNTLLNAVPSGVSVSTLDIETDTVKLSGNSFSKDSLDTFFNNLVSLKNNKDTLKTVVLKSFTYQDTTQKYNFIVEITLL